MCCYWWWQWRSSWKHVYSSLSLCVWVFLSRLLVSIRLDALPSSALSPSVDCVWQRTEIQYVSINVQFSNFHVINLFGCQHLVSRIKVSTTLKQEQNLSVAHTFGPNTHRSKTITGHRAVRRTCSFHLKSAAFNFHWTHILSLLLLQSRRTLANRTPKKKKKIENFVFAMKFSDTQTLQSSLHLFSNLKMWVYLIASHSKFDRTKKKCLGTRLECQPIGLEHSCNCRQ